MQKHEHCQFAAGIHQTEKCRSDVFLHGTGKFFPYAQIDVVRFPDGEGGDQIVEKIFKGPLQQQLREAFIFIHPDFISHDEGINSISEVERIVLSLLKTDNTLSIARIIDKTFGSRLVQELVRARRW